jgi:hypothetical protein
VVPEEGEAQVTQFLQIILLAGCIATFFFLIRRIQRAHMQISDSIFWIGLSILLLILALIPDQVDALARMCGVADPTNFVFLIVIFLLLVKLFSVAVKMSRLETRLNSLIQHVAISEQADPVPPADPEPTSEPPAAPPASKPAVPEHKP